MFLRYLHLDFLVSWKNSLIRKLRLISEFMTWQTGQQIVTMHILLNISRSKGNQIMKFGQTWEIVREILSNYITFRTVDPERCSVWIFYKKVWDQFPYHILCMIFQEKYFSCHILLTDLISLAGCLCLVRYWSIFCCNYFLSSLWRHEFRN